MKLNVAVFVMNRTILLFILSFFFFTIYAQNIRVESFEIVLNDVTASVTPVLDANDEPCALIRLITTDNEYDIDGCLKRIEKTGELFFYIPAGTRQVTIRHKQLGLLNYSFEERLQSKATYRMVVPSNTIIIHNEDRGGHYLVMNITPANAVVHIDGMMESVTNGILQKFLPYGNHTYRVEAPLYQLEEGSVEIGREKKQLVVALKPNYANVTLNAQGAEIRVNGESKGSDSWNGRINPGTYLVETVKVGYRNATYTLVVVNGENRSIDLPMPMPMYASLDVSSNAINSSVYLDGQKIGNTPDIFKVLAGKHTVELRANGYESKSYTVELTEGEAKKLFAELITLGGATSDDVDSASNIEEVVAQQEYKEKEKQQQQLIEESVLIPFFDSNKVKYGFIDKTRKEVVECKYDAAERFAEGLAAVKKNGKWGIIDKTGKEVVKCKYSDVLPFSEGLVRVERYGKWGIIDKTGKEVIECKYELAWPFSEGLAKVKKDGYEFFIDRTGKEYIK